MSDIVHKPRQVIHAVLHQDMNIPGIGYIGKTLDAQPHSQQAKVRGLKMWVSEIGLEIELRGRRLVVPLSNVSQMITELPKADEAKKLDEAAGANSRNAPVPGSVRAKLGTATVTG